MRGQTPLLLGLLLLTGCSKADYDYAPVSGKVTMNGKPLAGAWVHFAPVAVAGKDSPGPTSQGQTDKEGKYVLELTPDKPGASKRHGAVVGTSRIYISLRQGGADPGADQPDAGGGRKERETVPRRYNEETTLTFDVPAKGTNAADFTLKSP